jgi:hypothetical protein
MKTLLMIHRRVAKKMAFDEITFKAHADAWALTVYNKVGYVDSCIGFIDGTMRKICRPVEFQNEVYSGFKKCHCIKFQGAMLANGLVVSLHGPIEGRRHDSFILTDSKIANLLKTHFPQRYLYGDAGYGIKEWLLRPYQTSGMKPDQKKFNKALSRARVSVEWFFGEVVQYWAHVDFKKGMKIGKSPVGAKYIVASFLTNAMMCANQISKSSRYFRCPLPTLDDYLANVDQFPGDDEDSNACATAGDDIFTAEGDDFDCDECACSDEDEMEVDKGSSVEPETPYTARTLAPDEMELVSAALHDGPEAAVVAEKYNISMSRESFQCLLPMQWLNDDIINFWFEMLRDRDAQLHNQGVVSAPSHFFSSFFFTQLSSNSYSFSNVSRWTRRVR